MITVVGIGSKKGEITQNGANAIDSARFLAARTFLTEASKQLKNKANVSFDGLFESADNFSDLADMIANELIKLEKEHGHVVYCTDGDGYSDSAVGNLAQKVKIEIIPGVTAYGARVPSQGAALFTATAFLETEPGLDTAYSLSVCELDNKILAGEVKLKLLDFYGPQTRVIFSAGKNTSEISLEDLDRQKSYGYSSCLFIPTQAGFEKERYCFNDLLRIMKKLTAPDGCEWDKAQTHESICVNMIEEAFEAADAIDRGDLDALIEETGDVMLQTVFHSDIAKRKGEFNFYDVVSELCKKLVSRHTHIFGKDKAADASDALNFWEKAKAEEKNLKSLSDSLDSIPKNFSALLKAEKTVKKAEKEGLKLNANNIRKALVSESDSGEKGKILMLAAALCTAEKDHAETVLLTKVREITEKIRALEGGIKDKKIEELI